jgi:hypothetical protein
VGETFELVDEPAPIAVGVLGLVADEVVVAERCSARAKREWPPACRRGIRARQASMLREVVPLVVEIDSGGDPIVMVTQ